MNRNRSRSIRHYIETQFIRGWYGIDGVNRKGNHLPGFRSNTGCNRHVDGGGVNKVTIRSLSTIGRVPSRVERNRAGVL